MQAKETVGETPSRGLGTGNREMMSSGLAGIIREMDEGADGQTIRSMLLGMKEELEEPLGKWETPCDARPEGAQAGEPGGEDSLEKLRSAVMRAGGEIHGIMKGNPGAERKIARALWMDPGEPCCRIASLVIIHAMARTPGANRPRRGEYIRAWEAMLSPGSRGRTVFSVPLALEILRAMPWPESRSPVEAMTRAAREADPRQAGRILQGLIPDRKALGVYHTRPESAVLAAHLAVPETLPRWKPYRMADYSCGAGELLVAAVRRAREVLDAGGENTARRHRSMMEEWITATDVMPASVAIAATELDALEENPRGYPESAGAAALRCGAIPGGRKRVRGKGGKWIPAAAPTGLGALDLLVGKGARRHNLAPMGKSAELRAPLNTRPGGQDLVIMNPPFTINPAVSGSRELREIRRGLGAEGRDGPSLLFGHLAHRMVRAGGTIALILPVTAAGGGRREPDNGKEGWTRFRRTVAENYREVTIVTVAGPREEYRSFSHDTQVGEMILIARRKHPGETADARAMLVNLESLPGNPREAAMTARAIRDACGGERDIRPGTSVRLDGNEGMDGTVTAISIPGDGSPWRGVRIREPMLISAATGLGRGCLEWRGGGRTGGIPMATLGDFVQAGPFWKSVPGGGATPVIQDHDCRTQKSMMIPPNEFTPKTGELGLLHLNDNMRYNSQRLAACITTEPALGGRGWPTLRCGGDQEDRAMAAWLNTTMGLVSHWWNSNRNQSGMGYLNSGQVRSMPVLDIRRLTQGQMASLEEIFMEAAELPLMAASEALRDMVRKELDRRVLAAAGAGREAGQALGRIREAWCRETTVVGTKGRAGETRHEEEGFGPGLREAAAARMER